MKRCAIGLVLLVAMSSALAQTFNLLGE
ncbi:MAG: hypothetical protein GDYSWBUE_001295, partial [Candidatus Fervidibacterota bacterium]